MSKYVHLNIHSHYSILEAAASTSQYIQAAVNDRQKALALTDNGSMFGCLEFYKECKKEGIKPILGMRAYLAPESRFDKDSRGKGQKAFYPIILLAKNQEGYKNLLKLSSLGYTEGFYYKPRIDKELLKEHHKGVIALSEGISGWIGSFVRKGDMISAKENAVFLKELFGDDFYIELQDHKLPDSEQLLNGMIEIANEFNIPKVATNNVNYLIKDHAVAHNILLYIQSATAANSGQFDIENLRFGSPEFYLKSQDEMSSLFADYPEAIENTVKIADKCDVELDLNTNHMPSFPIPESSNATDLDGYLKELVYEGLHQRYGKELSTEVTERADFELQVIKNMGFPGYFLIVWDFIKAAREMGVSVGPGRGSAAGSLVAFALEITNVDPLKYDLLFERFLNPERVSMPDIDIDFNDEKRDMVIDYVKQKYGEDAVAQIITFGTLSSKAVLTDVGRVLGVPLSTVKDITKKIPVIFGKVKKLKEAIEIPELKWLKDIHDKAEKDGIDSFLNDDEKKIAQLIKYSLVLEGKVRGTGIHAAGVVIAPSELTQFVPIYKPSKQKEQSLEIATQYSMNDLEDAGLLKMDFLGLKTLSIIENNLDMIKENHGIEIDIYGIDLNDKKTYDLFSNGDTLSVFQFESGGMQDYLKKLKPENLEEITAMNALYRPGPMENIPEFIDRKFGRKPIEYLHPLMEVSLKNTYGIIVYQEQVMKLVQDIAGFSLGQADKLRRAMGKKKIKEMDAMKPLFVEGAAKHDISEDLANSIFDLIYKFANYGFNKSHSLAYSYVAFQTGWLKAHYPAEFIAANMTAEINDQDKIVALRDEAEKFDIKLLPPDINKSVAKFTVKNGVIYFGLAAIRNVGIPAVDNIVEARKEGPFKSFFDFASRVDTRLINKRSIEALICAGAFDSLGSGHRASLMESIDLAFDYARSLEEKNTMQIDSLFGGEADSFNEPKVLECDEWTEIFRLEKEKEFLNFYVSGHPLYRYEPHVESIPNMDTRNSELKPLNGEVSLCGLITGVRNRLDKENRPIAFVELEDFKGKCECIFWSDAFDKYKELIKQDTVVFIKGKPREDEGLLKVTVDEVLDMDQAVKKYTKGYKIWIDLNNEENLSRLEQLKSGLNGTDERHDVAFIVMNKKENYRTAYVSHSLNVELGDNFTQQLVEWFGHQNVRFLKHKVK